MNPFTRPQCVYALMQGQQIVYVGCTCNPIKRFQWHRSMRKLSADVTFKVLRWYKTCMAAFRWEGYYIEKHQPTWNITGKRLIRTKAKKIWLNRRLTKKEALARMPGWTEETARHTLGAHPWL